MEEVNPLKETFLMGALNVGLPTLDVYSDIALSARLYSCTVTLIDYDGFDQGKYNSTVTAPPEITINVSHPFYAISLFIPVLINYALGWRAWYYGDMKKPNQSKKFTWIFALLSCYPQLVASRIIYLSWKQPQKASRKKKNLERNITENEVFTEAVPSTLIMTFIMVVLFFPTEKRAELLGDDQSLTARVLFFVTFASSALSAGLGLAKGLKVRSFPKL